MATRSEFKSVYAVFGKDGFAKRRAIEKILARQDDDAQLGPTRVNGSEAELADVLDGVRTYSLLGGRQIVVVENADPFITRYRAELERYCQAPAESGTLILESGSLPSNTRLYKAIAATGEVIKCDPPRGRMVTQWIMQQARSEYGKRLDMDAASMIRDLTGDDPGQLDAELSKLALFVGDKPAISSNDIDALVGNHRERNVFAVTDAIAAGDAAGALAQWERVLATDRAATGRAIGGLAWAVRRMLDIKLQAEAGANMSSLARQAYTDPATLKRRVDALSVDDLQTQLADLLQADLDTKTGLSTVRTALEKFVVTHARRGRRRQTAVAAG